jgi:CubicO group peptidase (beta-lactamase class C family)
MANLYNCEFPYGENMELVQPESIDFSSARLSRIRPVMQRYIDENKYAGILSLVSHCGQVVHFERFGWMDIKARKPMEFDALFRIYSMTKPITSAAAMMLLEEGCFRLADPVSAYIPELKNMKVLVGKTDQGLELEDAHREITIRDLFTHTAGFSYGFDEKDTIDQLYRRDVWGMLEKQVTPNLADFVRSAAQLPLRFHPGTAYHYSVAIDVLGYLVEVVSGIPFDQFLHQRIFEPLGMVDTGFSVPSGKLDRLACMYGPDPKQAGKLKDIDPHKKSMYTRPTTFFSGGGGLVSTAADYLRFCQMLLNQGELDGQRLLGRKTVELMMLNHLPEGIYEDSNKSQGFGLGGYILLDPARKQLLGTPGTFGWGGAANTKFWIDFQEQVIGILMIQYQPSDQYPIEADFINLVYQSML